jgi:dephospho-CoA kinase
MFAAHGAHVFYADEIGRALMQPGEQVYAAIVAGFGPSVVKADGSLDRAALAKIAFGDGRIEELNAIVHPATIARQAELIEGVAVREPNAVTMVESALIFQTKYAEMKYSSEGGWQKRFDRVVFVQAAEELKIARFVERSLGGKSANNEERSGLEAEARRRLGQQTLGERNAELCDYVLSNDGSLEKLRAQVDAVWLELKEAAKRG